MDTVIVVVLLWGSLLVIFGGLVGHSLSQQMLAGDLRRTTELRREIGERWREMAAERQHSCCPHCGEPLRRPFEPERTKVDA